jgi:acyl carrier protein
VNGHFSIARSCTFLFSGAMNREEVKQLVRDTMARAFNVEPSAIADDATPDSLREWDSLGQINLIMDLQDKLGIKLTDAQAARMQSFAEVMAVVEEAKSGK